MNDRKITSPPKEENMTDNLVRKEICGVVMPISAIDGCTDTHWLEVREIISESINKSGLEPNLVSDADEVGIIQKRIIQNLYENPMVVCDVSGKNPNVMFELGMRLAFDRPTIIVKDDKTSYSFDTASIEHLEYPRDLRFKKIVEFKEKLTEKIIKTREAALNDPSYTTFLKHFGEFKVVKIDTKEVASAELIFDELKSMRAAILRLSSSNPITFENRFKKIELPFVPGEHVESKIDDLVLWLNNNSNILNCKQIIDADGSSRGIIIKCTDGIDENNIKELYENTKKINKRGRQTLPLTRIRTT